MIDALCIGDSAYDLTFVLDSFPEEDKKYMTRKFYDCGGGPAANAAVLLSRWGINTAYAGILGNDPYGFKIIEELEGEGVDTSMVERKSDFSTPISSILVNAQTGTRTLINRRDQYVDMHLSEKALTAIEPKAILLDGHQLQASINTIEHFPDAVSILDAGSFREATETLAGMVDFLLPSASFSHHCTGINPLDSMADARRCLECLMEKFGKTTAITLGDKGLVFTGLSTTGQPEAGYISAEKIDAIDSTGAGDIFHGAFTYGIIRSISFGEDPSFEEVLSLAGKTAALSVEKPGARTSIPAKDDVKDRFPETARYFL
jgi:sulfofructose kinase